MIMRRLHLRHYDGGVQIALVIRIGRNDLLDIATLIAANQRHLLFENWIVHLEHLGAVQIMLAAKGVQTRVAHYVLLVPLKVLRGILLRRRQHWRTDAARL